MASGEVALQAGECVVSGAAAERVLVDQCRRGDPDAFARLVSLHEGMVFNLSARLLGDAEEARDLSQEVFLQVYRHLGRFQGRSSLKTWIYRIVVNQCRNRRRWWRRRNAGRSASLDELTPAEEAKASAAASGGQESPLDQACRRQRARQVQAALVAIPFHHRTVLVLREVEGLSCEAIASALGLPEGTVKSRLARARESLRRRLLPALAEGDLS
jgi:RNA polymerase sigma-70 factor (ECF subfamily)